MNLFLDSSVVLAACGRPTGAARALFDFYESKGWTLQTSSYVLNEVNGNIARLPPPAAENWMVLERRLHRVPDILNFQWVTVFGAAKDRPILFTAAAWSDVLLTLDRRDFGQLLGGDFYGLSIMTPGNFLMRERHAGRFP